MQDPAKIICQGQKPFANAIGQCTIKLLVIDHKNYDTLEVIAYDPALHKESPRIFLNYCVIVSKLAHEDIESRIRVAKDGLLRRHETPDYVIVREFAVNEAILEFILHHLVLEEYSVEDNLVLVRLHLLHHDLTDELQGGYDINELICEKPDGLVEFNFDPLKDYNVTMAPLVRNDSTMIPAVAKQISTSDSDAAKIEGDNSAHGRALPHQSEPVEHHPSRSSQNSPKSSSRATTLNRQQSVRKGSFSIGLSALTSSLQRSLAYVGSAVSLDTAHKHYRVDKTVAIETSGATTTEHSPHSGRGAHSEERETSVHRAHAYDRAISEHAHLHSHEHSAHIISPRQPLSRTPSGHSYSRSSGNHGKAPQVMGLHQFPSSRLLAANRVGNSDSTDTHTGSQEFGTESLHAESETNDSRKGIAETADGPSVKQDNHLTSDSRSHSASNNVSLKDTREVTPPSTQHRKSVSNGVPPPQQQQSGATAKPPANARHPPSNVTSPITSPRVPHAQTYQQTHPQGHQVQKTDPALNGTAALPIKPRLSGIHNKPGAAAAGASATAPAASKDSTSPSTGNIKNPNNNASSAVAGSSKHPVRQFFDMVTLRGRAAPVVPAE